MSYYYLRSDVAWAETIRGSSELVMIDSGAHSFQKGKKVDWVRYTSEYAAFIKRFDRPNVVGYFEMDVDNIIGYPKVLELREKLRSECGCPEKIIPVWHKNRGIEDFKRMCEENSGRVVAITGWRNEDIRDEQYPLFVKHAWGEGCEVHCLGMTRKRVLDRVPFDFTDSSSWVQRALRGWVGSHKVSRRQSREDSTAVYKAAYLAAMRMQLQYHEKWRTICKD